MMTSQQREFGRLTLNACKRIWKLDGHIRWMAEKVQMGAPLDGYDIDCFYDRYHQLCDTLRDLRRSELWRTVDVEDDVDSDE